MTVLCKYKDIFGKEKTGIHKYRVFDIAIFDVLGTLMLAYVFSHLFKTSFLAMCVIMFVVAILIHRLFCVNTTINKMIFGHTSLHTLLPSPSG